LWYTTFDGNTWSPNQLVPDIELSKAPATVIFNGNHLQCVHEGYGDSGWLWYASFDGNQWSKDQELGGHQTHGTSEPPALVVFNRHLRK
jgi:chitinase